MILAQILCCLGDVDFNLLFNIIYRHSCSFIPLLFKLVVCLVCFMFVLNLSLHTLFKLVISLCFLPCPFALYMYI